MAGTTQPPIDQATELDPYERQRREFAEAFGLMWEDRNAPRMEGRVVGYLMVMRRDYISSAEIGQVLQASTGSVSITTRRLVEVGFIRRVAVPGDRAHYFRVERDVWGSWLAGERAYLDREKLVIQNGLDSLAESEEPGDDVVRERLENGRDYMVWIAGYHKQMLQDWERFKAERDAKKKAAAISS